jgi:hypothetical protein
VSSRAERRNLLLVLAVEQEYGVLEFTGRICYLADASDHFHAAGSILSPSWKHTTGRYDIYADLTVRAYLDPQRRINQGAPYAWRYEYHQPLAVDTARAAAMATFLRRVDKTMNARSDRDGYPDSLADYVARFADTLGVTRYVTRATVHTAWQWLDDIGMRAWIISHCHHTS